MGWLILLFILGGLVATVPFYLSQKDAEQQKSELQKSSKDQTQEIISGVKSLYQISQKIEAISGAIQKGDTTPQKIDQIKELSGDFSRGYKEWAQNLDNKIEIIKTEQQVKQIGAEGRAKMLNEIVRKHYEYFLESLGKHVKEIQSDSYPLKFQIIKPLPNSIILPREPVIGGDSTYLATVLFPSGRKWTVIYTSGGASEVDQFFPYFHVALAKPGERDHGPNYFELHMQQKSDGKIVFSIRTNFGSIKEKIAVEDGDLGQFNQKIDAIFESLLEIEVAQ